MPINIQEDHDHFRDKVERLVRRGLTKKIRSGKMWNERPKGGRYVQPVKHIDIPHFTFGDPQDGVSRGPVKPGDVIGQDDDAKGNKASQDDGDAVQVSVDLDFVFSLMQEEFKLPDLKPKNHQTFEEIKYRYTSISTTGPESLRHNRRTWKEAIKRLSATDELNILHEVPGLNTPIRLITPIKRDRRYRQRKAIHLPSSNAAIIYMRDGSFSVDENKRRIMSNIAWWSEKWIERQYKKVQSAYIWHDNKAKEVDRDTWYDLAGGGGTTCSSAFTLAGDLIEYRFPPATWNIYAFYFTDGENWSSDNEVLVDAINRIMPPEVVNMLGVVQVLSWRYEDSVKQYIDEKLGEGILKPNYSRTASVGPEETPEYVGGHSQEPELSESEEAEAVKNVFRKLFGTRSEQEVAGGK